MSFSGLIEVNILVHGARFYLSGRHVLRGQFLRNHLCGLLYAANNFSTNRPYFTKRGRIVKAFASLRILFQIRSVILGVNHADGQTERKHPMKCSRLKLAREEISIISVNNITSITETDCVLFEVGTEF